MNYEKEIGRRDKKIDDFKNEVAGLKEEIVALRQLLDCLAANLSLAVEKRGGKLTVSKTEVSDILKNYTLKAEDDGSGNYILELVRR